jgi:hypothetical protein
MKAERHIRMEVSGHVYWRLWKLEWRRLCRGSFIKSPVFRCLRGLGCRNVRNKVLASKCQNVVAFWMAGGYSMSRSQRGQQRSGIANNCIHVGLPMTEYR